MSNNYDELAPNNQNPNLDLDPTEYTQYSADISRTNPGCFLFLIDQSGSMDFSLGGQPDTKKSEQAADTLNRTLDAISQRCSQGMDIRDYFQIGAIGYHTDALGRSTIKSLLADTSVEQPFLSISQVVDNATVEEKMVKESDGAGGLIELSRRFPVWITPEASYGTPMCEAIDRGATALERWIAEHRSSYPPIVINISDGMATDGDPVLVARNVMGLATDDGPLLMFNVHLSDVDARPIQFPNSPDNLPDEHAKKLFEMSSVLPAAHRTLAATMNLEVHEESRGFIFNANLEALVHFLEIGTRGASASELH